MENDQTNLVFTSTLRSNGDVELVYVEQLMPVPADDEIVVEMQAAPINPTDMFLMGALADPASAERVERNGQTITLLHAADWAVGALASRVDQSLPVGSEGAGKVIAAGSSDAAQALIGRTVALWGAGTYARYYKVRVEDAMALPDDVSATEGAAAFINPITALAMIETMRHDGFTGLVHTAAASSLGQMMCRICQKDGIPLVNIVRSPKQVELLRSIGAEYICDSSSPSFDKDLQDAVRATGARVAFDATGGGILASQILAAMEVVNMEGQGIRQYGSTGKKKVYVYGKLDVTPIQLLGTYGLSWDVAGWLIYNFLEDVGADVKERLKARVASEVKTTFATSYSKAIGFAGISAPQVIIAANEKSTGGKYLVDMANS